MNKDLQQENVQNEQNLWDAAIADTERKLQHVEARAKRLKAAINSYRAHRDAGIPWPTESEVQTNKKAPTEGG